MMGAMEECLSVTEKLIQAAQSSGDALRDSSIGEIEKLLGKREALLAQIRPPFSESEQALGEKLLEQDRQLTEALKEFQFEIKKDMTELEHKKTSAAKYVNPYAATRQHDGAFYDKRK